MTRPQTFIFFHVLLVSTTSFAAFIPKKIATGTDHTCVLSTQGQIKCWGENYFGQIGLSDGDGVGLYPGTMGSKLKPVDLGPGVLATDVCAGSYHSCAVTTGGKIKCWGFNNVGQLGQGREQYKVGSYPADMGDQLPYSNVGEGFSATSVTCGAETTCALSTAGKSKCWGSNNLGQLGIESDRAFLGSKPEDLGDNLPYIKEQQNILEIRAGYEHICAILADKSIKCWGQNKLGELGLGNSIPHGRAKDSMDLGLANPMIEPASIKYKINSIALGNEFTCAAYRLEKNLQPKLKCWGLNGDFGILGVGSPWSTFGDRSDSMADNLPAVNLGMDDLSEIQSYKAHSCARDSHNRIKCWGANQNGTLGLGDSDSRGTSGQDMGSHLPFVDLGLPVKSLAQGFDADHTCAILINNQIKCWGNGMYGQLGYESDHSIGREPNEMGDNLPFVRLE